MTLDDAALIALARELPVALPSRTQREEVRTAVLAARARLAMLGGSGRVRASMLVVGTLASAAGVALALAVPTAPRAVELHGEPHETVQVVVPHTIVARERLPPPRRPDPPKKKPEHAADELAYDAAWSALRTGELARAAIAFARAHELAPEGPLADDAAYWRGVALARAGQRGEAIAAFRTLLDEGARSVHAGAASAMLGWLLFDDHASRAEAGQRFRAAADDLDQEVRASSRAGLAAIARGDE